jgi:CBS domain-containing protein
VHVGTSGDLHLLQRLYVEQVPLESAVALRDTDPLQRAVDLTVQTNTADFIVVDKDGAYLGMLQSDELKTALIDREAVPLLVVGEVMRVDVPVVCAGDSLADALDYFAAHDVGRLPVAASRDTGKIIGVLSRAALMRRYYAALADG